MWFVQRTCYELCQAVTGYEFQVNKTKFCVGAQVKALQAQVEQEQQKKSALQTEVGLVSSEVAHLRARETQLTREVIQLREGKKSVEEELHKVKAARSVDNLQMKELQDQLEAEQYFSVCCVVFKSIFTVITHLHDIW